MMGQFAATVSACLLVLGGAAVRAAEPNETFADRTLLPAGVLSVIDDLTGEGLVPPIPDTLLGVRDLFGSIYFTDDNSSPYGDGTASGIGGVPIDSGSIDFAVTGYGDDGFFGSHGEQGDYEVFVDVYDFFGDLVDSFSEVHTLEPGGVDDFY
ncbi:MAG: hypothetical protein CMJ58_20370 [Planctomycetaceae bacterium]|nr:hypothetical protein [Planctomycetaceae bacterium]